MPLPKLTSLQFLVLVSLMDGELAGRDLRAAMKREKVKMRRPAFYRLMGRLEDSKFVKGKYENKTIDDQIVRERRYKVTATGVRAVEEFELFAASRTGIAAEGVRSVKVSM